MSERESMNYDVVIVGAGPAGLAAAIRLKQLESALSVCVLEKAAEVGGHILSGAVIDPRALTELLPDWQQHNAFPATAVRVDHFTLLTKNHAFSLPTPPQMQNEGNYIVSLGNVCRFLAEQATQLGVEIYPGFAAKEVLYNDEGAVCGITTGDFGLSRAGEPKPHFQSGIAIYAPITLFAEGCRGSLSEEVTHKFGLRDKCGPQTYALGIKELWEIDPAKHNVGEVLHTVGWPLDSATYGGAFMYHMENNQISLGFVVGLDYQNPYLSPFQEFQRFKTHPAIRTVLAGGKRIAYGARALNEGGYQSIPQLVFPGGALIGCSAGFLDVPKIKGSHNAMKSGILAAEALVARDITSYPDRLYASWVGKELYQARNIRPAFRYGLWGGLLYAALDTFLLRGKAPWTFAHHQPDHACLKPAKKCQKIIYPAPDGTISFDLLSSVYLANTRHEEDQPVHLTLKDSEVPIKVNLARYDAPEQRYCPAGVYEIVKKDGEGDRLQINAANCIHCKTCDIKDPSQNIVWTTPEGGSGPNYPGM